MQGPICCRTECVCIQVQNAGCLLPTGSIPFRSPARNIIMFKKSDFTKWSQHFIALKSLLCIPTFICFIPFLWILGHLVSESLFSLQEGSSQSRNNEFKQVDEMLTSQFLFLGVITVCSHSWFMSQQLEQVPKRLQIAIWGLRFVNWNVWLACLSFSQFVWAVNFDWLH